LEKTITMGRNQNTTYFHTTLAATATADQILKDYEELKQWQYVAEKYNVCHAYIIKIRKRLGIFNPTLTRGKNYGGFGSKISHNGTKHIDFRGYIVVGRYHPDNDKEEVCYEHTLVMEKYLGRKLEPGEIIHHIDNDKTNNSISNLFLCNHSKHRKCDLSAQKVCYELYKNGIVEFDYEQGIYKIRKIN
jgi:hypothetical protein